VGSIASGLNAMWEGAASAGKPTPEGDSAKATQVNFVLHLGLPTDAADAQAQFDVAVRFSRAYPCRVVVLCPEKEDTGTGEIRAKVYGECSLGKSKGDTRCCEFVLLSYTRAARPFLENQVSICLSSDLPIYYWAHRFSDPAKLGDYTYLLSHARRVIVDSAVFPAGSGAYAWPRLDSVRDLAYARLLPVRQALGQFLGKYPAASLVKGLKSVTVGHGPELLAEARCLIDWVDSRLAECGAQGLEGTLAANAAAPRALSMDFVYDDARSFRWTADLDEAHATFDADFGQGRTSMTASARLLAPEAALSEAMFF
jgi:Glucose-6-phosphate dehydrogenase subunit